MTSEAHDALLALAEDIQDGLFEVARGIREGGEEVAPQGFVLVADDGGAGMGIIQVPLMPLQTRPRMEAALDALAQKVGAYAVIIVIEAWSVAGDADEDNMKAAMAWTNSGHSLEDFPDSVELITSTMRGAGVQRLLYCEICGDGSLTETAERDYAHMANMAMLTPDAGLDN